MKRKTAPGFESIEKLSVTLDLDGQRIDVGKLAWSQNERRAYFEYDRDFLARPLPLSPFKLVTETDVREAGYRPFGGLHGVFNDSLPDGWGRLLLDRRLQKLNYDHRLLTPLDRLACLGQTGMGALRYAPGKAFEKSDDDGIDLDWLAAQVVAVQAAVDEADVDRLLELQGGSAGVRPKIMIGLNENNGKIVADTGSGLQSGYDAWLLKFKSMEDPAEVGAEEYAYSLMAKTGGVDMPPTRLIKTDKGAYFAVRRFDRTATGGIHIHTVSGLLEIDHRMPAIDYDTLLKVTRLLTRDERHVKQMFVRMVFNVLAHNRDDHSKNHAFLMASDGVWHPTPAYDLTLSEGPAGEHNLAVDGEGRRPAREHMAAVAERASISKAEADQIIEQVKAAVKQWPEFAAAASLSDKRAHEIDILLNDRGPAPKQTTGIATSPADSTRPF